MSDDPFNDRARGQRPASPDSTQPGLTPPDAVDDPEAALRRLESMGTGEAAVPPSAGTGASPLDFDAPPDAGLPSAPAVDAVAAAPSRPRRLGGSSSRRPKASRPRPAGSRTSRVAARIAAPIVFLVAVIALVGIVVNSGVVNAPSAATPTPAATSTKSVTATKKYVIKSGDSLTSIAIRFHTTTDKLIQLNPGLQSSSTLVVGTRIVVPKQ